MPPTEEGKRGGRESEEGGERGEGGREGRGRRERGKRREGGREGRERREEERDLRRRERKGEPHFYHLLLF